MNMKYQKPEMWVAKQAPLSLMSGSYGQWADAKENSFEEEDAPNPIKDIEFHNIWEDAEDED
jgi:hypothetical protein